MEELRANYNPDDLICILDNATRVTQAGLMHATDLRPMDHCRTWTPELLETIGLYHAYIRRFNTDARVQADAQKRRIIFAIWS